MISRNAIVLRSGISLDRRNVLRIHHQLFILSVNLQPVFIVLLLSVSVRTDEVDLFRVVLKAGIVDLIIRC